MLDAFEIVTTTGVVLWSRANTTLGAAPVNSLINNVFIEEKVRPSASSAGHPTYRFEKYTLKWTVVKELGLIFVVCTPRAFWTQSSNVLLGCLSIDPQSHMDRQAAR